MVSEQYEPGIVSTKMEVRFENLERDHANFKGEFDSVKDMIMEIRNTLERLDNIVKNLEGGPATSQTTGDRTMAEVHVAEREVCHGWKWR